MRDDHDELDRLHGFEKLPPGEGYVPGEPNPVIWLFSSQPDEAALDADREADDAEALERLKRQVPTWQAQMEQAAWRSAELLAFGMLTPRCVTRFRRALAEYDRRRLEYEASGVPPMPPPGDS